MSKSRTLLLLLVASLLPLGAWARPTAQDPEAPFLERVDAFWAWFEANERRIHRNMFEAAIVDLGASVDARVDRVSKAIGWSFGAGDRPGEHALVLTPNGSRDLRLLTEIWVSRAPELDGWTVRAARPPADLSRSQYGIGDTPLDPSAARLTVEAVDGAFQVALWHPLFDDAPAAARDDLAQLLVEEALGEDGTLAWLGSASALESAPPADDAWTLARLQDEAGDLARASGMPTGPVLGEPVAVELPAPGPLRFPRAALRDVVSRVPWFVREHHARRGRPRDPLRGTGAQYATVRVPRSAIGTGLGVTGLVAVLDERLPTARVLGHAVDDDAYWVDLLVLDRVRTIGDLARTLRATEFAVEASLEGLTRGAPDPVHLP